MKFSWTKTLVDFAGTAGLAVGSRPTLRSRLREGWCPTHGSMSAAAVVPTRIVSPSIAYYVKNRSEACTAGSGSQGREELKSACAWMRGAVSRGRRIYRRGRSGGGGGGTCASVACCKFGGKALGGWADSDGECSGAGGTWETRRSILGLGAKGLLVRRRRLGRVRDRI